jgi:hypothetical protein
MKKSLSVPNEREAQVAKFKAAARKLDCEKSDGLYDVLLRKLAQQQPMMRRTPKSKFAKWSK